MVTAQRTLIGKRYFCSQSLGHSWPFLLSDCNLLLRRKFRLRNFIGISSGWPYIIINLTLKMFSGLSSYIKTLLDDFTYAILIIYQNLLTYIGELAINNSIIWHFGYPVVSNIISELLGKKFVDGKFRRGWVSLWITTCSNRHGTLYSY